MTTKTKPAPDLYIFTEMLNALHLACRELSDFYTPEQSEALRVVIAAIANAERQQLTLF